MSLIPRQLLELIRIGIFSLVLICVIGTTLFFLKRYAGINTDLTFFLSLLPAVSLVVGWVGWRIDNIESKYASQFKSIDNSYEAIKGRVDNLSLTFSSFQQTITGEINSAKLERDKISHGLLANRARLDSFYRTYGEESDLKDIKGMIAHQQTLIQDVKDKVEKNKE